MILKWLFLTFSIINGDTWTDEWCVYGPLEVGDPVGINVDGCYQRAIIGLGPFKMGIVTYIWDDQNEW